MALGSGAAAVQFPGGLVRRASRLSGAGGGGGEMSVRGSNSARLSSRVISMSSLAATTLWLNNDGCHVGSMPLDVAKKLTHQLMAGIRAEESDRE
jgi:hypothetical protein